MKNFLKCFMMCFTIMFLVTLFNVSDAKASTYYYPITSKIVTGSKQSVELVIMSDINANVTLSSPSTWVTFPKSTITKSDFKFKLATFKVNVSKNTGVNLRRATITARCSGKTINFYLLQKPASLQLESKCASKDSVAYCGMSGDTLTYNISYKSNL